MELRQLRHFLAIVDSGSFSRAAEKLGKSQQALSKSLQALEESLGVRLLDRNPRVATPTVFGELLLPYARNIDLEATGFRERLAAARRADHGRVRLGASPAAATGLVTEAVLRLAARQPNLQIAVLNGIYTTMVRELLAGELDLFVCIDNEDELDAGLTKEILLHDEYRVIAAASHPLASATAVPVAKLCEYGWIMGRNLGEIEQAWRRAFEQAELTAPEPVIETSSVEFCKEAIQSSEYLTVLPRQLIGGELERNVLCCIEAEDFRWLRPIALHYRRNSTLSPGSMAVIDALHSAGGRYQRLSAIA